MTIPVWKVTRTLPGRRLFEALAAHGVILSRLEQFRRKLDDPPPESTLPDELTLRIGTPEDFTLSGRMARPELTNQDRIVAAVMADQIIGIQPITLDRPFYVKPLERTLEFDGAYFWGLYVVPEWRRRGVATTLLARALVYVAEESEVSEVATLVGVDNVPSKRVLQRVGFERETLRSYYRLRRFQWRYQQEIDSAPPARAR